MSLSGSFEEKKKNIKLVVLADVMMSRQDRTGPQQKVPGMIGIGFSLVIWNVGKRGGVGGFSFSPIQLGKPDLSFESQH